MRYFLFVLINSVFNTSLFSQEYITINYYNILVESNVYNVSQNAYTPSPIQNYDTYYQAMSTLQQRYDNGFYYVKSELDKLRNLKLINSENIKYLEDFKTARTPYWKTMNNMDFSRSDVVQNCLNNYILDFYVKNPNIVSEIKLLQSCNNELSRIKLSNPDNYIYTKRYKSISIVLKTLETCKPSEIKDLTWEKVELGL